MKNMKVLRIFLVILVNIFLVSTLCLSGEEDIKTIYYYSEFQPENVKIEKPDIEIVEINSKGIWKKSVLERYWGGHTEKLIIGTLDKESTDRLFSQTNELINSSQGINSEVTGEEKKLIKGLIELSGFQENEIILNSEEETLAYKKISKIIKTINFDFQEKSGGEQKIEISGHSMVGEGSEWDYSFDSSGNFVFSYGGYVGPPYTVISEFYIYIPEDKTNDIFERLNNIVEKYDFPVQEEESDNNVIYRPSGETYSLYGFKDNKILVEENQELLEISEMIKYMGEEYKPTSLLTSGPYY